MKAPAQYNHLAAELDAEIERNAPRRIWVPMDESDNRIGADDLPGDGPAPLAPPVMPQHAYPALVRDVVSAATYSSEAHPVAVAANVLALFCCAIGRTAFQRIGDPGA